jgi:hypothetical protein
MNELSENDIQASWRNHQRIRFIKGFYKTRKLVSNLFYEFERTGEISHTQIDDILETQIRKLKDVSHILYRMPDEFLIDRRKQRIFDKVFGEMWHELDKSRDNIRLIEVYAQHADSGLTEKNGRDKVMRAISRLDQQVLNAARRDLPFLLRRSRRIMDKLVPLFEDILHVYKDNEIILRSIYFSRDKLDDFCNPSTIDYFFPLIYGSVAEGFFRLVQSMIRSQHFNEAQAIVDHFTAWMAQKPATRKNSEILAETKTVMKDIRKESVL